MATMQRIIPGDCIAGLRTLPDASVHCCVTSPPYWGLRDYGHDGQIGLEETPEAYVARIVEVFREVWRVLRDDGTVWLNLGDSYAGANPVGRRDCGDGAFREGRAQPEGSFTTNARKFRPGAWEKGKVDPRGQRNRNGIGAVPGLKPKNLVGIPWRVAFALQADGWWLRQDIIWHKTNPMPESVRDRCTKAHEYVFLLAKSDRYYYDAEAIKEGATSSSECIRFGGNKYGDDKSDFHATKSGNVSKEYEKANKRSVWKISTKPYSGAHFAVMPPDLVEPCIKAGCPEGGTVLDPFAGSGTTLAVAAELGRNAIGCELNPDYIELAERRILDARQSVALFEAME